MDNPENHERGETQASRSWVLRYGLAVVSIVLATWIRLLLDPVLGDRNPFSTILLAVLFTAWYGGLWPSLCAVIIGWPVADYFLVRLEVA